MSWMDFLQQPNKENTFKVNLGKGLELLTYSEMQYRFDNLTEDEKKYLEDTCFSKGYASLKSVDIEKWDLSNVTPSSSVFTNLKDL